MHERHLETLEFFKILGLLARHTSFSASRELAQNLRPSSDLAEVVTRQKETSEACSLLGAQGDISMGGVHDVRPLVLNTLKGIVLTTEELLDVRDTLVKGRTLRRQLDHLDREYPVLSRTALLIEECAHVSAEVSRCINERAEVMDTASPALARIRKELDIAQERLMERLRRFLTSPEHSVYLQEQIITQRHGRYVIPLKAHFKGRIPGLIHDESSSGATLFIEPLATVDINNTLRELQLEEQREVNRILGNLSSLVADEGDFISRTVEILAQLDLAFAKARYSFELRAESPDLVPWKSPARSATHRSEDDGKVEVPLHPGSTIRLQQARHPLLPADEAVPIDVHLSPGEGFFVIVITGPNTGGKTVSLKTVGLLVCMAQAGLHIPVAENSALSIFEQVFADIGDEQSIEQSLSTFSSHMVNLIGILKETDNRSLVLLDELGAGTDPVEGSALARSLLSFLLGQGSTTLATTHYSDLKVYAHMTPGAVNASVEYDLETLSPTYELNVGLPGQSNAFAIAGRLGLDQAIIEEAQASISADTLHAEGLLAELKETHRRSAVDMAVAQDSRKKLEEQTAELRRRLLSIEEERQEILETARHEAQRELASIRKEVAQASTSLRGSPEKTQAVSEAEQIVNKLEGRIAHLDPEPRLQQMPTEPVAVGDTVWIPGLEANGEVANISGQNVEVQVGQFRVQVDHRKLSRVSGAPQKQTPSLDRPVEVITSRTVKPTMELDLRGWRVEEGLTRLERYLDDAYLSNLPWVNIIHGRGTGALRRAVRETLSRHPLVTSFRPGEMGEGGDGVTVIEMATG
jgi:DNA mismatch repair protein MutS2